ncbi:MAG TPA: hypothetical protein VMD05_09840 [Candidatus Nanoarchaeia archaeon]|nr:hypothetical protein [Candidatus Nanoarchaeia archaeon]
MHRSSYLTKAVVIAIFIMVILTPLCISASYGLQLTNTSEYSNNVFTIINSPRGNYTYITKPIFPVMINDSQIALGENWTIICPLQANHNYHIYCYGDWINISSQAKTDYDFKVYDPNGNLVSSHTQSAGFPPHLGTTTVDPLFTPTLSGNYSFVIINNPLNSQGAQQATFMIIENLQPNQWYTSYVEGRIDHGSSLYTIRAYEFVTNATQIELFVQVPYSLDIYEARLYLMNNAQSQLLLSYPLPWEPGLYGNLSGSSGGYNFDSTGYRGVSYASCEYMGQDLILNYTPSSTGLNLYHLVLIGEQGSGNASILMKTDFENQTLTALATPARVFPGNLTQISYTSGNDTLKSAQLTYTIDNWTTAKTVAMIVNNQTINATIPAQSLGSLVQYQINATDVLMNTLVTSGNFTVKEQPTLNISAVKDEIKLGENITIVGNLTPNNNDSTVQVQFADANSTQSVNCTASGNGTFVASFKPGTSGLWAILATSPETPTSYRCDSLQLTEMVAEPPIYVRYSLFITIALVAIVAVGGVVYFVKFREK